MGAYRTEIPDREEGPIAVTYNDRSEFAVVRAPHHGIAAVLSVLLPGLGQVYAGRLLAGGLWFLGTSLAYWALILPGFLVHACCVWSAYSSSKHWVRY